MAHKTSLVPSPQQLQAYGEVSAGLPVLILKLVERDAQRDLWYALTGMITSSALFLSVVGAFVYLIMHEHPTAAGSLLGAGVLGVIQAMLRARLHSADKSKKTP
jgi:hypothetical protein